MDNTQMVGSEKQVAWATQIRQGWLRKLDEMVETAKARVGQGDFDPRWVDCVTRVVDSSRTSLMARSAKQIIDNRNAVTCATIERSINQAAMQAYKG